MSAANECVGLMGRIFGHQYLKSGFTTRSTWEFCFRCGRRVGQ